MIKNLLFVAKVIYLISPESDITSAQEEEEMLVEEEEEEEQKRVNGHSGEEDEEAAQEKEEEDENENEDRPPSLLWLMKKLLLMAKREAANTPKVPLKVHMQQLTCHTRSLFLCKICYVNPHHFFSGAPHSNSFFIFFFNTLYFSRHVL